MEMHDLADDPKFTTITAELNELYLKTDKEREFAPDAQAEIDGY